jgi:hypothetical protein
MIAAMAMLISFCVLIVFRSLFMPLSFAPHLAALYAYIYAKSCEEIVKIYWFFSAQSRSAQSDRSPEGAVQEVCE